MHALVYKRMVQASLLLALAFFGLLASSGATEPELPNFPVLGRSSMDGQKIKLSPQDRARLDRKQELVLGFSSDISPFEITLSGQDYEGLTADFVGLISQLLDIRIIARRYPDRDSVIRALIDGEIDMLGVANNLEAINPEIRLSQAYIIDQPVLVTRIGERRSLQDLLQNGRLATHRDYQPLDNVRALYPKAEVLQFASSQEGLQALFLNQVDVYLGSALPAYYLINQSFAKQLKISNLSEMETQGFSFAVHSNNDWLLRLINAALDAIPQEVQRSTVRRWSGGMMLTDRKLMLTQREQQWIQDHPVVRVATAGNLVPVAFFDQREVFRGISADVLNMISQRTNLKFEVAQSPSTKTAIDSVLNGNADIVDSIITTPEREKKLIFTRPYTYVTNVLVTRNTPDAPVGLADMNGKRLAIPRGHIYIETLRHDYPLIKLKLVNGPSEALKELRNEQADAALTLNINADYYIGRSFPDQLRISNSSDFPQAGLSYAMRPDNDVLHSIMEKAVLSLPPDEISVLVNQRWRTNVEPDNQGWSDYSSMIYRIIAAAAILLLAAVAWNSYQRREINRRKRAELALSDQVRFMEALINGTPHPIYVRDRDGLMVLCNDHYLQALGLTREDVMDKSIFDSAFPLSDHLHVLQDDYRQVMQSGQPVLKDRNLNWGGKSITIYHWIQPYRDAKGAVAGVICGWVDISERRALIEELQAAKNMADDASLAKTKFLATMSHEIRTPMNAVIGMLELALKQSEQGQLDRSAIETAYQSARGMLELIGDILDIVRIESGKLTLEPERANIRELVESIARVFDGLARQKSLALSVQIGPNLDRDVMIDPLRFKQILSNLVGNAIKFTERGQILITVSALPMPGDQLQVNVLVEDSGIGIPEADQHAIFQPFVQARNPLRNVHRGTGLGLAICRTLCEMMGSQLLMQSTVGVGTRMQFSLNLQALATLTAIDAPAEILQTSPTAPLHVLVVDDHPANRKLLSQQVTFLGHTADSANDGKEGMQAWLNGQYDLIITDSDMPIMNGYELTLAVRKWEREHAVQPCTIIGLTANALREELARCLAAGMNDCLFKPLDLATLNRKLTALRPLGGHHTDQEPDVQFDFRSLKKLTGGDAALIEDLLDEIIKNNDADMAQLLQAASDLDHDTILRVTDKLKGTARLIKAERVLTSCEALEQLYAASEQEPATAAIQKKMTDLNQAVDSLQTALTAILKASRGTQPSPD